MGSSPSALIAAGWIQQPNGTWYFPGTGKYVDSTGTYYVDGPTQTTTQPPSQPTTNTTTSGLSVENQMNQPAGTYHDTVTEAQVRQMVQAAWGGLTTNPISGESLDAAVARITNEVNTGTRSLSNLTYWLDWTNGQINSQPTTTTTPPPTNTTTTTTTSSGSSLAVESQMQQPPGTYSDTATVEQVRQLLIQSGGDVTQAQRIADEINSGQRSWANVIYWTTGPGGQSTGGGGAGYGSGGGSTGGGTGGTGAPTLDPPNQMGQPPGTYDNSGITYQMVYDLLLNQPGGYDSTFETIEQATQRIYNQLMEGTRSWDSVVYWVNEWQGDPNADVPPEFGGIGDTSPAPPGAGAPGAPGVWAGGTLYRVQRDNAEDLWIMVYEWNGFQIAWQFDSQDQMMAQTGGPGNVGGYSTMTYDEYQGLTLADGPPPSGSGSFQAWINTMIADAAANAGIGDPTLWGQYVNDPEIQAILVQAAIEGWSEAQLTAAVRQTSFYQNVLYPGIANFFTSDNPEAEWYQYYSNVVPVLEALGVDLGDDNGRGIVGDMLTSGVSDLAFINMSGVFQRAKTSEAFAAALNEWTMVELGRELDFDTWYDVIAGVAEADIRDVVNKAILAYQNSQTGAGLTQEQIANVAEHRPALTDADSAGFLRDYMSSLQSVRDILGRYGITSDELLAASAGIESDTGRSLEEIQRLTRQAAGEAGRLDDEKVQFFLDFTPMGTPRRLGLTGLAPESG